MFDFAPNGVTMSARIDVGFKGDGLVPTDSDFDTAADTAPDTVVLTTVLASKSILPATGDLKDIAQGDMKIAFEHGLSFPGATSPVDLIRIAITGDASAFGARNLAGNPANAQVSGKATAEFFLDADFGGVAPDDVVGQLEIGAIRSLATFESVLQIQVFEDGATLGASLPAGSSATPVELRAQHAYQITFDYSLEVPFGSDPPFSFEVDIPIQPATAAPEPASALLAGVGCSR